MQTVPQLDSHAQLRALYKALLEHQEYFDEFKQLLALYQGAAPDTCTTEPESAKAIRSKLNDRIRSWTGAPLDDLSASQVLQWRAIIVEERINVAVSPWKESNSY